jgi:predicted esterase
MVVRLPKGHSADKKPARIFAYCYYFAEAKSVIAQAKNDKAQWNEFADKHGFATLSWNTQTLWASRKSQDELNRWDFMNQDREFDVAARAWERGLADLCRTHNLQDTDLLLYGCSRGAHFALRLAMRQGTKRFSAVHAHVPNSFEKPLKKSEETVWLISNGDMDTGTTNARRFYQQARDSNFPIFIKFFRGLGHAESPESLKFSRSFFELFLKREASGENVAKELSQALDDPQYTFDLLNDVSFPVAKSSYVPESQRIPLPDEEFASVWGRIIR